MMTLLHGDCREVLATLPERSVQCCITSPPYYGLRSYSTDPREIGRETTPAAYVAALVAVFRAVWRVLRDDGTLWVNLGDSYAGSGKGRNADGTHQPGGKQGTNRGTIAGMLTKTIADGVPDKNLLGMPWRVAFALQDAGWILRSDIIWSKPNPMPESVRDRPTRAHEYVFLFAKRQKYFYDATAIAEASTDPEYRDRGKVRPTADLMWQDGERGNNRGGLHNQIGGRTTRNRRSVWTIATQPYSGAGDCVACRGTGVEWTAAQRVWGVPMSDEEHKVFCKANPCPTCDGSGKDGTDHFATMPEALIEPCILAGSASQACETCGAAWGRVVERSHADDGITWEERKAKGEGSRRGMNNRERGTRTGANTFASVINCDLGFAPRCRCATNTGSARSIVLDPFGGSGTVARVAERFGRDSILIDLNADYLELQEQRTNGVQVEFQL